jgi:hypothetical protein
MEADPVYQFGEFIGTTAFLLLLNQLIHWIVRKIRRRPRKQFREWLRSWITGPELLVFGFFYEAMNRDYPFGQIAVFVGSVLFWIGLIVFLIKIITYFVALFRYRVPGSPSAQPSSLTPPLGRQPPLG